MKKIMIIILMFVLVLTGCSDAVANITVTNTTVDGNSVDEGYEVFFENSIHELRVSIDEDDFRAILDDPLAEAFYSVDIVLDDVSLDDVAMRTKGNSTLRDVASSESERYSFKFKMNEYEDQKLFGLDEFVVNNMYSDASYMREYISYDMYDFIETVVPMSSFVNVYINDELYGFYLLVETIDDSFMNNNFGDNDGNLYRADQGTTLLVSGDNYSENVDQKNGDDTSKEDLYYLMDVLNDMPDGEKGEIESVLDVKSALTYIAGNTLLESYDSLSGQHGQNYYLYNDDGTFVIIPWDYNMAFGTFGSAGQTTIDIYEPVQGVDINQVPLIQNLLEVEEYRLEYENILKEMITYFENFESDVAELADLIRPYVEDDPSKFTSMENFELNVIYQEDGAFENEGMGGDRPGGMPMGNRPELPDGERPERPDGEKQMPPEDMADGERPEGEMQTPPEGMLEGEMIKNGMSKMGGSGVSIINIIQARIDYIETQLN